MQKIQSHWIMSESWKKPPTNQLKETCLVALNSRIQYSILDVKTQSCPKHWEQWGRVCPVQTSSWGTASRPCWEEAGTPVTPILILLLCKLYIFFRGLLSISEAPRSHERWTKLLPLSSLNFHSTRVLGRHANHLLPPGLWVISTVLTSILSFLTPLLGETFKSQQKCYHKSSESYHPKHSFRTDFI